MLQDASCAKFGLGSKKTRRKASGLDSAVTGSLSTRTHRLAASLLGYAWANQALHLITLSSVAAKHIRPSPRRQNEQRKKRAATKSMSGFRMSLGTAAPPQTSDDAATFQKLLADMSGTKESIKQAKEWLLQRPDRAETFAKALQKHVMNEPVFRNYFSPSIY